LNVQRDTGESPRTETCTRVAEARERLGGISRGLFYNLVKAGSISITKLGRRSFVSRAELSRFAGGGGSR
jgi:hypothetical protein